ncbi:ROK family protein [Clostridium sp. Sa3CUN1]|uniref:ROK family protein n=1 Tax=Clostridium gallinarum TaxID=2762246 RepID=A0ABR8Q2Q4_9CLOT|nr:ROK family protein [Clostridium gallinarum]MBD7914698.1 ROK family protein [Clostridium gallinarum]
MKKYIVFDIGGSSVKHAIITEDGEFIDKGSYKSQRENFEVFKSSMIEEIEKAKKNYNIDGVAISAPGGVDSDTGIIGGASALPCIHGPNFKKIFGEDLGLKLEIENDANCAALGEVWKGAAKDNDDVLFVVCGTGIGGAIIKDKKIHKGNNLHGGEFGYSILRYDGNDEKFKFKMWSHLGSTGALIKDVAKRKGISEDDINGQVIFELAEKGDKDCIEAIDSFYFYNAVGIFNLQYIYDPEKILIGGAISNREDFIDKINEKLEVIIEDVEYGNIRPTIERCKFKNDANLLGALYNYLQRNN